MPLVTGLLETALYVDDLDRAIEFYTRLFDFEVMNRDDRFCALDVVPRQVLLLFRRGGTLSAVPTGHGDIPPHDGSGPLHLAFAIDADQLDLWRQKLAENGIAIESTVHWPRGSTSLYFRDPDSHLVELATPNLWPNY